MEHIQKNTQITNGQLNGFSQNECTLEPQA